MSWTLKRNPGYWQYFKSFFVWRETIEKYPEVKPLSKDFSLQLCCLFISLLLGSQSWVANCRVFSTTGFIIPMGRIFSIFMEYYEWSILCFFLTKNRRCLYIFKCIILTSYDFSLLLLLLLLLLKLILKYIAHDFICVRFCVKGHLTFRHSASSI